MATTTPNYGWTVPTSTDLVKDGATAIETLGDAIDASMNTALGTKKAGLVLLNTTSFSGVSSQSVNDVFSATYTNYMIQVIGKNDTTNNALLLRLRVGGVDNTSSNYAYTTWQTATNNTSGVNGASTGTTQFLTAEWYTRASIMTMQISNPFATDYTVYTAHSMQNSSGTPNYQVISGGFTTVTTSYTGFTIYPGASTMTGVVKTYGYN